MDEQKFTKAILFLVSLLLIIILGASQAYAVPSFKRQTGQDCITCHTMFPELTPIGRAFKLTGYVLNNTGKSYTFPPPVSAMAQVSYTNMNKSLPPGSTDIWSSHFLSSGNDNIGAPQQLSLFYAGQIYDKVGAFIQGTYANDSDTVGMDGMDIRYANSTTLADKDLIFGITVNNNPTIEDVWNSTPAFSFPYAGSNVAPTPAAAALIDNGLATQVGGAGVYAYWNSMIYAAASVYRTARDGITYPMGAGDPTDTIVDNAIPYWRLALMHQFNEHSFSIGTYGLTADVFAGPSTHLPTDHFTDLALDAQYQYLHDKHAFSVQTTWIHEDQNRSGSLALKSAANKNDALDTFRMNFNYYYRSQIGNIGGTVAYFSTTGDTDTLLYAPAPVSGSRTGSPDSNGVILEMDYMPPWKGAYTKFSLQYVIYNQFNGSGTNYDGFGRNASDNNTLYFLAWLAF